MANELRYRHTNGGLTTLYAVMFHALDPDSMVNASDGTALALSAANWTSADISLTAVASTNQYLATIPTGTPEGDYHVSVYLMAGAAADEDADTLLGSTITPIGWDGTALIPAKGNVTHVDGDAADADQDIINLVQARR